MPALVSRQDPERAAVAGTRLPAEVRGAARLVVDLTLLVTDVVETMHHNIGRRPGVFGRATLDRTRGITGLAYRTVRGVTRLVGTAVDAALVPLAPLLQAAPDPPGRDAVLAMLNGVLGDRLEASGNPLAIPMQLRIDGDWPTLDGARIAGGLRQPRERIVVMAHGLCMSDASWNREGHDHGRRIARRLKANAVYLRYNSGRHISANGAELARLLQQMVSAWPVPVREVVLVGHSMGGLVIRSACAAGEAAGHGWTRLLGGLVFLGTPHHGAPLERGGHGVHRLLAASPYTIAFTRLARLRSAGITDLRHGSVLDRDWHARDRFGHGGYLQHVQPLPANVPALAVAGSQSKSAARSGKPRSDGLVPVASALGRHADPGKELIFDPGCRRIVFGTGHLELLSSREVARHVERWLEGRPAARRAGGPG